jgi:hypothetical protein
MDPAVNRGLQGAKIRERAWEQDGRPGPRYLAETDANGLQEGLREIALCPG